MGVPSSGAPGYVGNDYGVQAVISVLQRGPLLSLLIVSPQSCFLILDLRVVIGLELWTLWTQTSWVLIPALLLTCCVTVGK